MMADEEVDRMFRELPVKEQFGAFSLRPHYSYNPDYEFTEKYWENYRNMVRPLKRYYLEEKLKKERPGFLRRVFTLFTDMVV